MVMEMALQGIVRDFSPCVDDLDPFSCGEVHDDGNRPSPSGVAFALLNVPIDVSR